MAWRLAGAYPANANTGILSIGALGITWRESLIEIRVFSFKKNAFENIVR